MIGKEVENKDKSSSKASRTGGLAKYITDLEAKITTGKCTYSNDMGFISRTKHAQIKEMIGLSQEAVRSKDTIKHYLFSWKQGEHPSNSQMDESVKILLKETGLEGHQVIYGVHNDTDNIHLHMMVNRVNPLTLKLVEINNGFDIEPIHRAIALIEHKQGWSREKNARYLVLDNGDLCRSYVDVDKPRQPGQRQKDHEYRTGEKSGQRIVIEIAGPIIKSAKSWGQLHEELAKHGVTYHPVKKGAVFSIAGVHTRASLVSPEAGFHKLQRRLGVYQPPINAHEQSINLLQPLSKETPGWDAYTKQKDEYEEAKNKQNEMKQRHKDELQELKKQQANDRNDILSVDWTGKRDALNALRSVVAEDHAEALKALRVQHKDELLQLSVTYPEWWEWKQSKGLTKAMSEPESKPKAIVDGSMDDDAETQNVYTHEPSERQEEFKRYSQALRADRYRVTSIRQFKDGSREILLLGDSEEGFHGYDAEELLNKEAAVKGLEKKGHILQYTPISTHKHHIQIDKMSQESLDRLLSDGYKPAVILGTAPGRFQAIITIPKSETPFDDKVGHVLTLFFNERYGDPDRQWIGAINPHIAPGSIVHLPENSNNVADTHVATLIKAECCECIETKSFVARILQELQSKQAQEAHVENTNGKVASSKIKEETKTESAGFSINKGRLKSLDEELGPAKEDPKHTGPSM